MGNKNNPDLFLNISLDYSSTIFEIHKKYPQLCRLTKPFIKILYIPNKVTSIYIIVKIN